MPGNNKSKKVGYSDKSQMPPLGVLSIAGYLQMHGYEAKCLDILAKPLSKSEFEYAIKEYSPDLIGISTYTETFKTVINISRIIKNILPKVYIILGGPHVSFLPEEALEYNHIDFISRGEGEATFVELLESINFGTIPISSVKGLSYKLNNKIVHTPERGFIEQLDSLPWYELSTKEKKNYSIKQLIITSRGCPGQCVYCASSALSGKKYRARSAENVFAEVYYKYHYKRESYFAFLDDTFTANKKRLYDFCKYIKESKLKIIWRCDSRADILSYDMIDIMAEAGCIAVHIGIESGSQEVIEQINKRISLKKADKLVKYMSEKGIQIMCSFIIGHHCDTHQTINKTLNLAKKFKEEYNAKVAISINTPFPGTELYKRMEEWGVKLEINNWASFDLVQAIISTPNLKRSELQSYMFQIQEELS